MRGLAFPARAHLSLSLSVCSVSVQHAHTSLSLSLCLLSFCSARTHISLSLSLCLLSFCSACTHISHSLTRLLSFCSARTYTSLSLSLSLSASAQILFSVWQRRAELNSVKHRYYVACFSNFTCKYSQNHSTAIVIILWVFYLIRQRLDYKDFCAD